MDRGKKRISCLKIFWKWFVKQGVGGIETKNEAKDKEDVESYDLSRSEGLWFIFLKTTSVLTSSLQGVSRIHW